MFAFSASVDSGATRVSLLRGTTSQDPFVSACAFSQQNAFRLTEEERLFSQPLPEMREEQVKFKLLSSLCCLSEEQHLTL